MDNQDKEEWYLAFVVGELEEGKAEPTQKINAIEVICHDTLEQDRRAISEYHNSLQLVNSVQLNIQQFLEAVVHYAANFLETRDMNEEKFDSISLNFSRLLLNIFSMFRSLLDHSNHSLSRKFGRNSGQFGRWKKVQSEQYDNLFEYRLFYKLRNYCQHVGMPPIQISFTDSIEQEGIGFRLDILRDKLLEEKGVWNQQLIADLRTSQEKISVIDSLHNWGEAFRTISSTLLDIKRNIALESAKRIVSYRERHNLPKGVGRLCAIQFSKSEKKAEHLNFTMEWLPEQKAQDLIMGTPH
ncbi:hypothetical protein [Candidatus Thiosymbion oneisti]|uniref:hypothetical protein n=1 Tax=Candidatus Thiosymbion oneisti TaxID=589554 RepID=UPI000AB8FC9C|nr:hypothetical protein [Candidatus Thiosymbion oneisti]